MDLTLGLLVFGWIFVLIWVPFIIFVNRKVHPRALFTLFFTELWERFSFYGMRALLVLYMTQVLFAQMSQGEGQVKALGIYGAYGALVYAMPVIGGMLADKILGFRKAIFLGGILMMLGHLVLAFEGMAFQGNMLIFFASLALIIIGNGFFKPNISSFLGTFYGQDDPRKDGAFTIFYMGVNIGAFLAPLTCGYLGTHPDFGWHYGFGLAGVGMLIGLIVFWFNKDIFQDKGLPPDPEDYKKPVFMGMNKGSLVIIGVIAAVPVCAALLNVDEFVKYLLLAVSALVVGYIIYTALKLEDKRSGQRLLVVVVLFFFHMFFWALFEQAGGSLTLFAENNVDREIFGSVIPTPIFQSLNPLFIMLLAPAFSRMWLLLRKSNAEPSTPMKFFLGLVQVGVGFGIVVLGANYFANEGYVPLIFLVVMYLFHTTGELSLSPVGLSMVTKLSPAKIVGFVMGAWFLSISLAHELAAEIGKLTASGTTVAPTAVESLSAYSSTYLTWGVLVVGGVSVVLLVLVPILRKWMHGIH